jgi:hypothetical protein
MNRLIFERLRGGITYKQGCYANQNLTLAGKGSRLFPEDFDLIRAGFKWYRPRDRPHIFCFCPLGGDGTRHVSINNCLYIFIPILVLAVFLFMESRRITRFRPEENLLLSLSSLRTPAGTTINSDASYPTHSLMIIFCQYTFFNDSTVPTVDGF